MLKRDKYQRQEGKEGESTLARKRNEDEAPRRGGVYVQVVGWGHN
jgi:hypothetical protein